MREKALMILFSAAFFLFGGAALFAAVKFDVETGVVVSGYNNVRIPGDTGTEISLSKDHNTDPRVFVRGRFLLELGNRRTVSILLAPLTLKANGNVPDPVQFQEVLFPPGTDLEASYRFNSWRLTYRYDFIERKRVAVGAGFTAKIRDAEVSHRSATQSVSKKTSDSSPC